MAAALPLIIVLLARSAFRAGTTIGAGLWAELLAWLEIRLSVPDGAA